MANWNGQVCTITRPSLAGTSFVVTNAAMPAKFFEVGQFAVTTGAGHSGTIGVQIIGSVGGATFAIAGRTNIAAAGSFPVPLLLYGISGNPVNMGIPRPYGVEFAPAAALGNSFTATVFFSGAYD